MIYRCKNIDHICLIFVWMFFTELPVHYGFAFYTKDTYMHTLCIHMVPLLIFAIHSMHADKLSEKEIHPKWWMKCNIYYKHHSFH